MKNLKSLFGTAGFLALLVLLSVGLAVLLRLLAGGPATQKSPLATVGATPSPSVKPVSPLATPTPKLPSPVPVGEIQVGEVIDLEAQFLERTQRGELTSLSIQTSPPQKTIFAGWSPDNQYVLLHVSYGETRKVNLDSNDAILADIYHLWLYKLGGGELREIVADEAGALPHWSPDGKEIAFLVDSTVESVFSYELWVISPGDGQKFRLATEVGLDYIWLDNDNLIFASRSFGSGEGRLWKVNITNQRVDPLTVKGLSNQKVTGFAFSGMNRGIALQVAGDNLELWLGSVVQDKVIINYRRQLPDSALLSWSPDGNLLAYAPILKPLRIIRSDGTEVAQIEQRIGNAPATWSPDNQKLIFSDRTELYVLNVDGSNLHKLTNLPQAKINFPVWSPNGRFVGFNQKDWHGAALISLEKKP